MSEILDFDDFSTKGIFDYNAFLCTNSFVEKISEIENQNINELNKNEQLAFWINAYNLLVLKAVRKQRKKYPNWDGNLSLFQKFKFFIYERHFVANKKMSLYYLENFILRKKFKDPRIHFSINCASNSCPSIPGKYLNGENLDYILDMVTKDFIVNQGGIRIEGSTLYLSKIFKWYKKDFRIGGGVIKFLNNYLENPISEGLNIKYQDYDWSFNISLVEL